MAHLPVQCQNCGAKYKIPDTFKSDSAKCKSCGNLIDVKSVREASDAPSAAPAASAAPKRATGGTRKPRQTATTSRKRHGEEEEDSPKKSRRAAAGPSRRSRRGRDDADDDEGNEGGRHYEKKKDNTMLITGVVFGALAVVAIVAWIMFPGDETDPTNAEENKVAEKPEGDPSKGDPAAKDAGKEDATKGDEKVAEGSATKDDEAKAAEAAAKKKKAAADAAAKKKKKKDAEKKKGEIKTAEDVYKPSSEYKKFERPAGMTEAQEAEINSILDDLRQSGGLAAIRAPGKLEKIGVPMIPIATNRLLELDYSVAADAQYAFQISEAIKRLTHFEVGIRPIKSMDPFDLKEGHENAVRVIKICQMTKLYWNSEENWAKYRKKYAEKFR